VKVSIVIPYYDQAQYLRECLESVVNQVFTNWVAIVVDDASHQTCENIVESFRDPRIIVIHHEINKGLAAARNTGIRFANTEWVLPLDADDKLSPLFLDKASHIAVQFPEVDAIFTDHVCFGEVDSIKKRYVQTSEEILDHHSIPGAGTMYKRKVWENAGGYCELDIFRAGNEDWDFWLSAYEAGIKPYHLSDALYFYRRYSGSMNDRLLIVDYKVRLFIYKRHHKLFDEFHLRNKFLSKGFENSAFALWKQGKRIKTVIVASIGVFLNIKNRRLMKLTLLSLASVLHIERLIKFRLN
jgi:glycosyltransferase involved in cell wall biosynthesis